MLYNLTEPYQPENLIYCTLYVPNSLPISFLMPDRGIRNNRFLVPYSKKNSFRVRFSEEGYRIMEADESVIVGAFAGVAEECTLTVIQEMHLDGVDISRLRTQLSIHTVLSNIPSSQQVTNMPPTFEAARGLGAAPGLMAEGIFLVRLYMTLPCSSATGERVFSTLRRVKSNLRSSMSQKLLKHGIIFNVFTEAVDQLDPDLLLRELITHNEMRLNMFSLPE